MTIAPIILIADRHDDALKCLKEELPTPFALFHARNGLEASFVLNHRKSLIAAAVVELELPFVNGFDLIGRLTGKHPKPKKIIATTCLEHDVLFALAKYMGADAIVRKPVPKQTLIDMLRPLVHEVRTMVNLRHEARPRQIDRARTATHDAKSNRRGT